LRFGKLGVFVLHIDRHAKGDILLMESIVAVEGAASCVPKRSGNSAHEPIERLSDRPSLLVESLFRFINDSPMSKLLHSAQELHRKNLRKRKPVENMDSLQPEFISSCMES